MAEIRGLPVYLVQMPSLKSIEKSNVLSPSERLWPPDYRSTSKAFWSPLPGRLTQIFESPRGFHCSIQ